MANAIDSKPIAKRLASSNLVLSTKYTEVTKLGYAEVLEASARKGMRV